MSLSILQISIADVLGGAERIALDLFTTYIKLGHSSWMGVGYKYGTQPNVIEIPNEVARRRLARVWIKSVRRIGSACGQHLAIKRGIKLIERFAEPRRLLNMLTGRDDFDYPGTSCLLSLVSKPIDIIHCHNLHGNYFDLRILPSISKRFPLIITLHDAWLLSGHCSHSLECEKWRSGCGACPYLKLPPAVLQDSTDYNWERKRQIFEQCDLYVSTPSKWLMQKVQQSILVPSIRDARVIPNGVNLSVFTPGDSRQARSKLGIPQNAKIVLFVGNGVRNNVWKDFLTMRDAVSRAAERMRHDLLIFIVVGDASRSELLGQAQLWFVPRQGSDEILRLYYQAADVYIHAAHVETFPNTILEAMACGKPVVATAVGGIPEQIDHQDNGLLVEAGDAKAMSTMIVQLLTDRSKRERMGQRAAEITISRFDLRAQAQKYLDWYEDILRERRKSTVAH